jgi:hypothetical protein
MASMAMVKQSVNKETPFIRAPKTSALCNPYEYSVVVVDVEARRRA